MIADQGAIWEAVSSVKKHFGNQPGMRHGAAPAAHAITGVCTAHRRRDPFVIVRQMVGGNGEAGLVPSESPTLGALDVRFDEIDTIEFQFDDALVRGRHRGFKSFALAGQEGAVSAEDTTS